MAPANAPAPFGFERHGYDREQVHQHVTNLESNLQLLIADRDSARAQVAELTRQLTQLREQMGGVTQPMTARDEVHQELKVLLEVTKAEAAEITARAQSAAEQTLASAQQASAALRSRYEFLVADLEAQQVQMHAEHTAALELVQEQLAQMAAEAEARRSKFGEQADRQHLQVEQEFEAAMAARRAALEQEITQRRAASEQQAAKLVSEATADAQRRTAEADEKVNNLSTLRQRVSERLRETGQLLNQSSNLLEPLDAEADIISGKPS
jgi:cell division septum initiation protein DivIVA